MKIEQYDRVLLTNGDYASIVEIFDGGKALLADIDRKDGTETDWIQPDDIVKVVSPTAGCRKEENNHDAK